MKMHLFEVQKGLEAVENLGNEAEKQELQIVI